MIAETQLSITYQPIDALKPYSRNPRTHSNHQIRQIANSIREFGFTNPVLVNADKQIIAGNGRVQAAKLLGMTQVPVIQFENMTADQVRAYVIADNKLAANAGWDNAILAIEFQYLMTVDATIDLSVTGFEIAEIDFILQPEENKKIEEVPGPRGDSTVSQVGDVWQLGKHRILCGSALEEISFEALLQGRKAQMVFADPPYNVVIDGNVSGKGAVKHGEFVMASGEMDEAQFTQFLTASFGLLARHSADGSVHFLCMDWRHMEEILSAGRQAYSKLLNLCVWVKDSGGMGSFYRSRHELVFVFRSGKARNRNNIQLGKFGRDRTNVWEYPGARELSQRGDGEGNLLAMHPTVKPTALVADAILDCSARGDLILDSFLGSGSTLIAAERTGRTCYGIELDPRYVDVAIERLQRHCGQRAIHTASGKAFDELRGIEEQAHGQEQ